MTVTYFNDLIQGTDEWLQARCGVLTASQMHRLLTAVRLQPARNEARLSLLYELMAQRITRHVEPSYVSDAMLRGTTDEEDAIAIYADHLVPVDRTGFITNDKWGFTLGYSPDGLVRDTGLVEVKSCCQKNQIKILLLNQVPKEHMAQLQTGLMVSEREWIDFISYCGGLPLQVIRVEANFYIQDQIEKAAREFEYDMGRLLVNYEHATRGLIPTQRREEGEITL